MAEALNATPRFSMRGIRKAFGATLALDGVDLDVRPGEVCALVGANGAGKSTLMGVLSGALAPDAGAMLLDGRPYRPRSPLEARRAGVAMLHQELSLAPHLSVLENILLGIEPARFGFVNFRRGREQARADADLALGTAVGELSPASQQLVELARAFAVGCRVLVLDEPTSSLGREDTRRLFELLGRLKAEGQAVVYISHFLDEVRAVADRFVVLRDGRNAGEGDAPGTTHGELVALMIGRRVDDLYPRTPRRRGEAVLDLQAFEPGGATLTVHRGEVVGIAGLLGSGRTRLLRSVFGLEPIRSGRVRIGSWSGPASPARRWQQGLGFVSEDRQHEGLAGSLSIGDNLTLSRLRGLGPGPFVWPTRQDAAAQPLIESLGIRCRGPRQPVGELSGGNQQKVALGRLLHHDVDLWLLDEPTRGIDVASKAQVYALVDELVSDRAPERPRAVLMVSSDFDELLGVCDRIAVMCRGQLGPLRPATELDEPTLLSAAAGAA